MNPFYQGGQFEEPIDADAALSKELTRNLSVGPTLHATAYVHAKAVVIGNVTVGAKASVWPCAVLLGVIAPIQVDEGSRSEGRPVGREREYRCPARHAPSSDNARREPLDDNAHRTT